MKENLISGEIIGAAMEVTVNWAGLDCWKVFMKKHWRMN